MAESRSTVKVHNQSNCWFDGTQFIPFDNMSHVHLKNSKIYAQRKELFYFNRYNLFDVFIDYLFTVTSLDLKEAEKMFNSIKYSKEKVDFSKFTSLENLKKFCLKKRAMYLKRHSWYAIQARNIDRYAAEKNFSAPDFPSEYHRNGRKLLDSIKSK